MATRLQKRKEAEAERINAALAALRDARFRTRHRAVLLTQLFAGETALADNAPAMLHCIVQTHGELLDAGHQEAYRQLVLHLDAHAPGLFIDPPEYGQHAYFPALGRLAQLRRLWIRPLAEWRPATRNRHRQFSHLLRHLLAVYPVPRCMDSLLLHAKERVKPSWFHHLGMGANLRTARGMPLMLTKKMAHFATLAPDGYPFIAALRWGQVHGLGGNRALSRAVACSRLGRNLYNRRTEEWWLEVIQWLVVHPLPDLRHILRVLRYLDERKERDRAFSMHGRTPEAVLRLMREADAEEAARERANRGREKNLYREFRPCGVPEAQWQLGRGGDHRYWTLREIRNNRDLREEGREMRHCIATYEDDVLEGNCSIWSLRVKGHSVKRALTVELRPATRTISEARGKCNRLPNDEERRILALWARANNLTLNLNETIY